MHAVPHGFTYICEYSTDSLFVDAVVDSMRQTLMSTAALAADTKYYWRVRALNRYLYDGVESPWSDVRSLTTSAVSGVELIPSSPFLALFPNPARNAVTITSGDQRRIRDVSICDLSGKQIIHKDAGSGRSVTLHFDDSLPRILFLRVLTDDGEIEVLRLLRY